MGLLCSYDPSANQKRMYQNELEKLPTEMLRFGGVPRVLTKALCPGYPGDTWRQSVVEYEETLRTKAIRLARTSSQITSTDGPVGLTKPLATRW